MELAPVELTGIELRRLSMPLVDPFTASHGAVAVRDVVLVRACADTGDGWAECVAMNEPTYTSEYAAGAHNVIAGHLVPRVLASRAVDATTVAELLSPVVGHPMAKAAVETAVLDAQLRAAGQPLAGYLGATRRRVPAGVSLGIAPTIPELIDRVGDAVQQGYVRVKLKIAPGWDIEPVAAVRAHFATLALQVDANGAYGLADTDHLCRLDDFDLVQLEQPLPADDLVGHTALAAKLDTPLCLDESITSLRSARAAIDAGACSIVNIKPGRVGGLYEARRIHDFCLSRGIDVWCGGMLETGIGRAANVALAALGGFTLPGDLSASDRYFAVDLTAPFVLVDGHLDVPTGPGIGVDPLSDVLRTVTVSTEMLRR